MTIRETLNAAIKEAMVAKDRARLQILRTLSAALKQIEIDQRVEVSDAIAQRELLRQLKQRQDAAKQYQDAGREDLQSREEQEIAVIREFLPKAPSAEEITAVVEQLLAETPGPHTMALMGELQKRLGGAEMAQVSAILRAKLQG